MTTYKVTKQANEKASKYFTDLMKAVSMKEFLKKQKPRDGYLYHIYGMVPGNESWFKLE